MYMRKIIDQFKSWQPQTALMLGSGLNDFADEHITVEHTVPYAEIDGFPLPTGERHKGNLILGTLDGLRVACLQGRYHRFEGYSAEQIRLPIELVYQLGVKSVLITNASGGIRPDLHPGDVMRITDHINMLGINPLLGPPPAGGSTRHIDMTYAWDLEWGRRLQEAAAAASVPLNQGVYVAVHGASFETPAEIKAYAAMGADAVGMSTVVECIWARHRGMKVLGLSLITNYAASHEREALDVQHVFHTAAAAKPVFARLVKLALPLAH